MQRSYTRRMEGLLIQLSLLFAICGVLVGVGIGQEAPPVEAPPPVAAPQAAPAAQTAQPSQAAQPEQAEAPAPSGMKVIEVAPEAAPAPAKPHKLARRATRSRARRRAKASEQAVAGNQGVEKIVAGGRKPAAAPNEEAAAQPSGMKMIEVPSERGTHAAKPVPKTVFVLKSGERLESDHYTMDPNSVHATVNGEQRTIAMSALDLPSTESVNHARGVELKIPTRANEVFVSF